MQEKQKRISETVLRTAFGLFVFSVAAALITSLFFVEYQDFAKLWGGALCYSLLVLAALAAIAGFATVKLMKRGNAKKKIISIWVMVSVIFVFVVLTSVYKSGDYDAFLSMWTDAYTGVSLKTAMNNILDISNYTPAYNYFLVIIGQLGINSLLAIKFITFIFTLLLAFVMVKLVCFFRKTEFDFVLFFAFLFIPHIFLEFTYWGQCDAIYTAFALLAFYFALKRRSVLCFVFLGLSFAFKMQALFIFPIIGLMLFLRDKEGSRYLDFRWIWIVPLMYVINFIPALFGESMFDLLLVYVRQSGFDHRISGGCVNIALIARQFIKTQNTAFFVVFWILFAVTIITLAIYTYIIWRTNKRTRLTPHDILMWATVFTATIVFLMPKMLDRFYYIAACLSVVLALTGEKHWHKYLCLLINTAIFIPMMINGTPL